MNTDYCILNYSNIDIIIDYYLLCINSSCTKNKILRII